MSSRFGSFVVLLGVLVSAAELAHQVDGERFTFSPINGLTSQEREHCVRSEPGSGWRSATQELGLEPGPYWRYVRDLNTSAQLPTNRDGLLPDVDVCLTSGELAAPVQVDDAAPMSGSDEDSHTGSVDTPIPTTSTPPETTSKPELEIRALVPEELADTDRQWLNPSLDDALAKGPPVVELAWSQVAAKWKTAGAIDLVGKTVDCVYDIEAGSAGIYVEGGRAIAIGVLIPELLASPELAKCLLLKAIGADQEAAAPPEFCSGVYSVSTADGPAFVAYAAAGDFGSTGDLCVQICEELPGCTEATKE